MKKLNCVLLLLFLAYPCLCQHNLDDLFKGGRKEYVDFIHKRAKYGDSKRGRYGLCLFSFTLHANDSVNNFQVLSSPSKLISERTLEVIKLSRGRWVFPKTAKTDSLNVLAGMYYIQAGSDRRSHRENYTQLDYSDLYNEYRSAGFETALPNVFTTPFIFIGIVTIKRYGIVSIE